MTISIAMTVAFNLPEEKEEHKQFLKEINTNEWSVKQTSGSTIYFKSNYFNIGRQRNEQTHR